MIVRRHAPHPQLAGIVKHYRSRTADAAEPERRIALPARTDVLLEFYFTSPHLLELQADLTREHAPAVAAVGPQTHRRVDLILSGRMDIFTIQFEPTGLYELLGVPMTGLTDAGIDGGSLFGSRAIADLRDALADASDLPARARIGDAFLMQCMLRRRDDRGDRVVKEALARIVADAGCRPAGDLARKADLSERQFRRLFERLVGMGPKRYARIVRFEAALAVMRLGRSGRLTDLAHEFNWFDQAHMDKDFRALGGTTPSGFAAGTPVR